jgi:hypothetical protein
MSNLPRPRLRKAVCFAGITLAAGAGGYLIVGMWVPLSVSVPFGVAFVVFQVLGFKDGTRAIFDCGEYLYYCLGLVGVVLFFVAHSHELSYLEARLKVAERADRIQALEQRRANGEKWLSDHPSVPTSCRPPQSAGESQTNARDPVLEACEDAIRLRSDPKFLMKEIDELKSERQEALPNAPQPKTDSDWNVQLLWSQRVLLIAIAFKLGKTTKACFGETT